MSMMLLERLKALGGTLRFHGNRFTQYHLPNQTRLHVWDPQLPPLFKHNVTIHDHVFEMHSTVLYGELVHSVYEEGSTCLGIGQYKLYDRYKVDRDEDVLKLDRESVPYEHSGTYRMTAGSMYRFPPRRMHDTAIIGVVRAVTLMKKCRVQADLEPWVLCPTGEMPMSALDSDLAHQQGVTQEVMWEVIERAVRDMSDGARREIERVIA
jgi:hypothetical protein